MADEIKKYLFDINEAILSIESYIGEKRDFNIYLLIKMLRRAVDREFEFIGEAMNKLDGIRPDLQISSKKTIIGMRNRVIHGYDKIDNGIVWGTIVRHLPILKKEINAILQS
jgi:uncharacterized protein with HEPN domain